MTENSVAKERALLMRDAPIKNCQSDLKLFATPSTENEWVLPGVRVTLPP